MNTSLRILPAALALGLGCTSIAARAQGTRADYERAQALRKLTENTVFKTRLKAHWFAHDTRFWYRNDLAGGAREFVLVDTDRGTRERAFDHQRLAAGLTKVLGREVRPDQLPI